ncbi:MAG: hypothetical protein ACI8UO_001420 [Verrucomicrobiales bacterium]|jgi:hypothetical protein
MRLWKSALCIFIFSSVAIADSDRPWSFEPLREHDLPTVSDESWPTKRIDHFLLAEIEKSGLNPAPQADSRSLIRRLYFDLIGLPPTPEEVAEFKVEDIEKTVEHLLKSPHYGERWGRHWLDLARYTDKTASWLESTASAWLYRDWVVQAFNEDMPYDDFVRRQLATDLIATTPPADNAALGFFGLSPTYWKELQLPPELIKGTVADEWEEHVDALGKTFLGLTLGCARCHDHKNDPVSAADYYAIAGVFASIKFADRPMIADELWAPVAKARAEVKGLEKKQADLKKKKPVPEDLKEQQDALAAQIAKIKSSTPNYDAPTATGVEDAALFVKAKEKAHGTLLDYQMGKSRDLPIHLRGDPNTPGELAPRQFLTAFPAAADGKPRKFENGSGRLDLANSIVEEGKPLSARVIVNRVWRHHFGRGLVETPSDFGFGGEEPSHPELLDDLAARFVENGWSIKWLHREILLSAAWRQSSLAAESKSQDPGNRLYARANRRKLDVEAWRDSMLSVSGALDRSLGGASLALTAAENNRRTVYGTVHRREFDQFLQLHDFPDPAAHSPVRQETTTPLQLLFTLNGPFVQQQSKILAGRLASEPDPIIAAYDLLFQREPTENEQLLARDFLSGREKEVDALTQYAHALLGSNEFLFID